MANEDKEDGKVKKSAAKKKKSTVTAAKKTAKVAPKKTAKKLENLPLNSALPSIYNDSRFTKHPEFPQEDLIRVLVRTPKEAFVFWKFSEKTLKNLLIDLDSTTTDGFRFRLKVEYKNIFGSERTEMFDLAPFTESYYLKFMFPVRDIQTSILVSNNQKEVSTLHSSGKDLPQGTESFRLDKEWIHPQWISLGLVAKSVGSDEYYVKDGDASEFYVNPRGNAQGDPSRDPNQSLTKLGNGSGSGRGLLE
ncbi:DUF4912 domain-containing protein [Leptospira meyeri]|uniref:DUF4912 domain-containing protein n=1 Tax=Leptospira meyeri TaxID=29508 RepID=UPI000C2B38FC|nr:DUF4912 domain-containing protein [Leptospira meyeri]PKA23857.1 hypothetical protein CH381_23560 [Leptospira sp. mixed culture ATI2-C-A1]TGM20937.1 hypothetical protein EHQ73_13455 [Leptospira meyeri]